MRQYVPVGMHGRTAELDLVAERLRQVASGGGGHLTVRGAPGLGKSRLLAEVAQSARGLGFAVAACAAGGEAVPALAPLAADDVALLRPDCLRDMVTQPDRRFLLIDRLRANLAERARHRPVLVTLDDAHLADPATLLVLRALSPAPARCLCVVARRPAPVSAELAQVLEMLRVHGAGSLRLSPLPAAAVDALTAEAMAATPDPALRELVAGAAGNPRYVLELLAGLAEEGAVEVDGGAARLARRCLPERLRTAVAADLLALSDEARGFLASASVFGRTFSLGDVASLRQCPGGRLLPAAHEALRAGFLAEEPPRLAFRHALVSDVLYAGLGEDHRRRLPEEAASVLSADRPPGETALQFGARARPGDRRAISLLGRAADTVALRSPAAAADILARVLELLPDGDAARATTAARASAMLACAGRLDEAERVVSHLPEDAGDPDGALAVRRVQALVLAGRYRTAIELADRVLAGTGLSPSSRAHLLSTGAAARARIAEPAEAEAAVAAAMAAGEATGQDAVVVSALCSTAHVEVVRGRLGAARTAAAEAVRRADEGTVEARRRHPRLTLALVLMALDRLDDAGQALVAVRLEIADYGSRWATAHVHVHQAALLLAGGRLGPAADEAAAALDAARDTGSVLVEARALLLLLRASLWTRSLERTASAALGVRRLAAAGVTGPHLEHALALADEADEQRWDGADPVPGEASLSVEVLVADPSAAPRAVRAALRAGEAGRAAAVAADIGRLARGSRGVPSLAGCARHADGLVRQDARVLGQAVDLLRAGPRPLALAAALADLARVLAAQDRREPAIRAFEEALALTSAAGATVDAVRVRRELRALGARGRYAVGEQGGGRGWDSLTRAERSVAQLVAEGLSNRRVAERLFVSSSTVDTHLQHIFGKLGINSRVQLVRLVAALGSR